MRRPLASVLALVALLALPATAAAHHGRQGHHHHHHHGPRHHDTHVHLLAINDLHGHLAPTTPGTIQTGCCKPLLTNGVQTGWTQNTVPAGGIAYLATHIKALRARDPRHTITVGAGDLIGASPLVSALFHDEPTIEAMNALGMQVTGVGNHEFDEGVNELLRMQYGNQRGGTG